MVEATQADRDMVTRNIKDIEALARHMCTADGNDPDARVTQRVVQHGQGMLGHVRFVENGHNVCPAWALYGGMAAVAIEWFENRAQENPNDLHTEGP